MDLDRLNFLKSIKGDSLKNIINNHFESTMLLYNIMASFSDIDIRKNEQQLASFLIKFSNEKDAINSIDIFNNSKLHLYDRDFIIHCELCDLSSIMITIE